jgi:hypothetical protein
LPTVVTADRGVIVHLAGRHHLSPALREGSPALLGPGDVAGRCGWEPFFRALQARELAIAFEADGSARAVPRTALAAPRRGDALAEARRFLRALRGEWPPA